MTMLFMPDVKCIKVDDSNGNAVIYYVLPNAGIKSTMFEADELLAYWFTYDDDSGELLSYSLEYQGVIFDWRFTVLV